MRNHGGVTMLSLDGAGASHVGLVRSGNEDAAFVGPTCLLVADGVGGGPAGEVASATAAHAVLSSVFSTPDSPPEEVLRSGVLTAQRQLARGIRRDPALSGMATTMTVLATDGTSFALVHVGDSRAMRLREGRLTPLTTDHTYVQKLVDEGSLDPSLVPQHPWRNVVLRSLGGAVGASGDVEETGELTVPDLRVGDVVLLASDGLTDLVGHERIEEILLGHSAAEAPRVLLEAALGAGGRDNVTCCVATVVRGPKVRPDGELLGALRDPRNLVDAALGTISA